MAAEQVLKLFDSYWFETPIFTNKTPSKFNPIVDPLISHTNDEEVLPLDTKSLAVPIIDQFRSYSDQTLGSISCIFPDSPSPDSVLTLQKLRKIPSGREVREFSVETGEKEDIAVTKRKVHSQRRRLRRGKTSRSLTELEFKELKGFMDLGFVFCEEDKGSGLVSLIPGLQRLGKQDAGKGDEENSEIDECLSSKPYLSEAWDVLDQRGMRNSLVNWRIPASGSEIDMKHHLRSWAHTVASIL